MRDYVVEWDDGHDFHQDQFQSAWRLKSRGNESSARQMLARKYGERYRNVKIKKIWKGRLYE